MIRYKHFTHLLTVCVLIALLIGSAVTDKPVFASMFTMKNSLDSDSGSPQIPYRILPWSHILHVTNTLDSGGGSLRQAISEARWPGEQIIFDPSLSGETITLTTGPLIIDKSLRIDGSDLVIPITISGNNTVRVFNISGGTVTLDSLTITNGKSIDHHGGGIKNEGGLIIINSTLSGNTAPYGGGIVNSGTLTIAGSTLSGNTASNEIYSPSYGGGIYNQGILIVTGNSILSGNTADVGGGIYNVANADQPVIVADSTLSGNTAVDGGGISNASEGTLTIKGSTLSENGALSGGGIENSYLSTMNITNSTLSENGAIFGGGIRNQGTLNITNSTISGNIADQDGGGIYNSGSPIDEGILTITNCTLSGNSGTNGGGIFNTYYGTLNYANTIIANSTSNSDCVNDGGTIGTNVRNLVEVGNCGVSYSTANPMIGPLADNGGPTLTHALMVGSPAIDAGDAATCTAEPVNGIDQRGVLRPQGAGCDIGAYEFEYLEVFLPLILR